jgi:hypothetical protein
MPWDCSPLELSEIDERSLWDGLRARDAQGMLRVWRHALSRTVADTGLFLRLLAMSGSPALYALQKSKEQGDRHICLSCPV